MALRQVILNKKIEALRAQDADVEQRAAACRERRAELEKREKELSAAIDEVTEQTAEDDKAALESEMDAFEADSKALDQEEEDNQKDKESIQAQIADLQRELDEINARGRATYRVEERRKEDQRMENGKFFGMGLQERDAFFARQEVQDFLQRVRAMGKQERAVSGADLLIPDVLLGLIREQTAEASKLLKHVNLRRVPGTSRMNVAGAIPEAVWTEMCASLNELSIGFSNVEMDGFKVGGFIPICNALLEDSDLNLATEIVTALGRAIGLALDKAILYGTGTKMPLGIVTRLAQTAKPEKYSPTARAWEDLHATNLTAITGKTGVELYKAFVRAAAAARNKYASGGKFWAMSESTKLTLTVEAMSMNASGAIVTAQQNVMPITGGAIETLDFIPDGMIIGGYGELYVLAERAGTQIARSEHARFLEDQTVFRGTARYDGVPVIAEGFVGIGIGGTAPAPDDVIFAPDTANP